MPGSIVARNIAKTNGPVPVLEGISLSVGPGDRIGVIGPNGIGKTTLLRVLAGLEEPDAGTVDRIPASVSVGFVPQEPDAQPGERLLAYLARRTGVHEVEAELLTASARLGSEPAAAAAYERALAAFLSLGGGDLERRVHAVAAELGLDDHLERLLDVMSGGERARARLAAVLVARHDVLLLDEPTNDLDFDGLARLESLVADFRGGIVVVSHDRAFLARTVTRILELEAETRLVREYAGGYAEFERMRTAARGQHERAFRRYSEERARFERLLEERRGEARSAGKQANRRATHALSTKVRTAEKRLERLETVEKPWQPWELRFDLPVPTRSGDAVALLEGAVAERGEFRLGPVDVDLAWSERVAVVGPNGSGKSTLLGMLLGSAPLVAGGRRLGPGVTVGTIDQDRSFFAGDMAFLDSFVRATGLPEGEARSLLGRFGIRGSSALCPAQSLTLGERTRGNLALLQARGANCLVLDEPTNHLDLEAIEELERALGEFPGTVVLVTHDRRLLEAFDATRSIRLERGHITIDR